MTDAIAKLVQDGVSSRPLPSELNRWLRARGVPDQDARRAVLSMLDDGRLTLCTDRHLAWSR